MQVEKVFNPLIVLLLSHDYHMIGTGQTYWIRCVVDVVHVFVGSVCVMQSNGQMDR